MKQVILITIGVFAVAYAIFSFINNSFDIGVWSMAARAFCMLASVVGSGAFCLLYYDYNK